MGKDISLILASGESLAAIIKASQEPQPARAIQNSIDWPHDDFHSDFPGYIEKVVSTAVFSDAEKINTHAGFAASWILASVRPAWYMRNCSVFLLLSSPEGENESLEKSRYISDWSRVEGLLLDASIYDGFEDVNYSLGCLISPENCQNFLSDYKEKPSFKKIVDTHFGIFTATLIDAMQTAIDTNTDIIESSDIFTMPRMDVQARRWMVDDQHAYSIAMYNETGIALQAFSIEAEVYKAQAGQYRSAGDITKADQYQFAYESRVGAMIANGNSYSASVRQRTGLAIPMLTPEMW